MGAAPCSRWSRTRPGEDTTALEVVADLHRHSVLVDAGSDTPNTDEVEAWLSQESEPASTDPVPSVLGRAVIPSAHTPSEILSAASIDEIQREETLIARDAYPGSSGALSSAGPTGSTSREPSLILSRHTVPANKAVPLTKPPSSTPEPIPLTQPSKAPKLKIQRVSSVVASSLLSKRPSASSPAAPANIELRDEDDGWGVVKTTPSSPRVPQEEPTVPEFHKAPSPPSAFDPAITNGERPRALSTSLVRQESSSGPSQPDRADRADRPEPTPDSIARAQSSYVIAPAAPPNWPVGNNTTRDPNQPPPGAIPSTQTQTALVPARGRVTSQPAPEAQAPAEKHAPPAPSLAPQTPVRQPTPAPQTPAEPIASPPRAEIKAEVSNFSDDWYQAKSVGGDEMLWETENPWKQRALALALVATVVIVLGVLLIGGNRNHEEPGVAANNEAPARGQWPQSPEDEIKIKSQPPKATAAPVPEGTEPKAPEGAPKTPVAPEGQAVAKAPEPAGEPGAPVVEPKSQSPAGSAAPKAPEKPVAKAPEEPKAPEKAPADPEKLKAHLSKGETSLSRGSLRTARREFKEALKLDPKSASAHSGLAMVYVELGKDRSAKAEAWRALKLDRKQARAHLVLALIATNDRDKESAKRSYAQYLRLAPNGRHASEVRRVLESL